MAKLMLRPNSAGYTAKPGVEVISVAVGGGASRQRRDFLGAVALINVSWMTDELSYQYLSSFFNTIIAKGSLPFTCDLLLDSPELTEHTCRIVPGTYKLDSTTGASIFNVSAQFEVVPIARDEALDEAYFDLYNEYGSGTATLLELLEAFANVTLGEMA